MLKLKEIQKDKRVDGVSVSVQHSLLDLVKPRDLTQSSTVRKVQSTYFYSDERNMDGRFQIQNRRFLGNKYKLLGFIGDIVKEKCNGFKSFCDIFAGTGVAGWWFNKRKVKIISNDLLYSNYVPLKVFLGTKKINFEKLQDKLDVLNSIKTEQNNYFSTNYGNTYFTLNNARKIGAIREKIEEIAGGEGERMVLLTSLLYATDKVANTVGHYDAYRKVMDTINPIKLLAPDVNLGCNFNNEIYNEDANKLIRKISCDVLYIDPPYNSRQYGDVYHLLENLITWKKPQVFGRAKKMDRSQLKSEYCLKTAPRVFADLIRNAKCKHILVSYNNTGDTKDGRSNARIKDSEIINILEKKGLVEVFERDYKAFTAGKSEMKEHTERVFYCEVIG